MVNSRSAMRAFEAFQEVRREVFRIDGLTREQATNLSREADRAGHLAIPIPQAADGTTVVFTTRFTRNMNRRDIVDEQDLHDELRDAYDKVPMGLGFRVRMNKTLRSIVAVLALRREDDRPERRGSKLPWYRDVVRLWHTMREHGFEDEMPVWGRDPDHVVVPIHWRREWIVNGGLKRTSSTLLEA
jgi:hypothetical protein